MAEKVVIPKAFTKEWYEYVWDYYKYHILVGIFTIVFLTVVVTQMINTVKYDANINLITTGILAEEKEEKLAYFCSENSEDVNQNERVDVSITQLNFTQENRANQEMHTALLNKLMVLFNSNDELLFIVDEYMLDYIEGMKYTEDIFYRADEWIDEELLYKGDYAVTLDKSSVLENLGIDSSDLYILLAKMDAEDGFKNEEQNAIKIAKFLLK